MTRIENSLQQFILGLRSPWQGLSHIRKHKQLKRVVLLPIIIIVFLFILCLFLTYAYAPPIISTLVLDIKTWVLAIWPDFLNYNIFYIVGGFFLGFLRLLFYLILFSLNLVFAWLIGNILCSFFWEQLAEKMLMQSPIFEKNMTLNINIKNIVQSMFRELCKELILIIIVTATWLMTFIPVFGQTVVLLVLPILTALILGYVHIDYAFSVLGLSIGSRFAWAKRHLPFLLGSGLYGLFFPVVYFLYPGFIVGGLLHYRDSILSHAKDT